MYVYKNFKKFQSSNGFDENVSMSIVSASTANGEDLTTDYLFQSPTFVSRAQVVEKENHYLKLKLVHMEQM